MFIFAVMEYKHKFKKHNISINELSIIFGSKNEKTFRNSSAYKRYINATLSIIEKVEQSIISKINE